ncbi:ABC transporter permease subunit [Bacillus pumilus]|nr:ABC transporter permease subunit [Bacillus pumilus]
MVKRQLLFKEWKQSELTFILVILVAALATPFTMLMDYTSFQSCLKDTSCIPVDDFYYNFHSDAFLSSSWIIGVLFALIQLGVERNKGLMDFTLSLPFSRSSIYHSKFMLGTGILVLIHAVSYGITFLLIFLLNPSEIYGFHSQYFNALIISLMIYSLFLAAGTLTGSAIAQALVAFSTAILPFLVIGLPADHLNLLLRSTNNFDLYFINNFTMTMSPVMYVIKLGSDVEPYLFTGHHIVIPIVMLILFYIIGLICFQKHPVERTGRFFLYPKMDRPIQIMVIVFGVLGFGMAGSSSLLGYVVGMLIGGAVGALMSYFLIYRKK